ncbi:MAG: FecR domain-containing protein [Kofleriaceae bacterium]
MTAPDDYLWDAKGPPDPDVARLEQLLAPLRHQAPLDEIRMRRGKPWIAIAVAVAAMLALVMWWRWSGASRPSVTCAGATSGFVFTAKTGTVACEGSQLAGGRLPVGATLDTGAHQAELAIANIGTAELGAQTRVRLDRTGTERHQLHLERGHMHARVSAPPRIFAVTTPSANVTDLGCEYTIDIDATGAGKIHVITGLIELETGTGAVVVAPAGTHARLLPGRRASLPLEDHAGDPLQAAVEAHERGAADGIERILATATPETRSRLPTCSPSCARGRCWSGWPAWRPRSMRTSRSMARWPTRASSPAGWTRSSPFDWVRQLCRSNGFSRAQASGPARFAQSRLTQPRECRCGTAGAHLA